MRIICNNARAIRYSPFTCVFGYLHLDFLPSLSCCSFQEKRSILPTVTRLFDQTKSGRKVGVMAEYSNTTHLLRFETKLFRIFDMRNDGREFFLPSFCFLSFCNPPVFLMGWSLLTHLMCKKRFIF